MNRLKLTWQSISESYDKLRDRGSSTRCERLIKQTATTFRFSGVTAAIPLFDISVSFGELSIEKKQLVEAYTPTAIAVDHFQYTMCKTLKDPDFIKDFTTERLAQLKENFVFTQIAIGIYSVAFEGFIRNPEGQRANFDESFDLLLDCFRNIVNQAKSLNAEQERRRAISRILSSVGIEGKDQERAQLFVIENKPRNYVSRSENIEDEILGENANLHSRLLQLISRRSLNSQLSGDVSSRIDGSSILEMTELLIKNGVFPSPDEKIRGYIEEYRRIGDKVASGKGKITYEEWGSSKYSLGVGWLHSTLDIIEDRERRGGAASSSTVI
jgi:hypothetical protein